MARPALLLVHAIAALVACTSTGCANSGAAARVVRLDGSSTVYPLTEAIAEDYVRQRPDARVTVSVSGTGGGLKRLCRREVEIAGASRPITDTERATCAAAGVPFLEVPVAYDGITVVVHPTNTFVDSLTVDELGRLWRHQAQGRVQQWADVRPGFPARDIHLYGAGVDSGTFDYFTAAVTGTARDSRGDFTSSEDDNTLVEGVAGDPDALGFFGYAYYEQHRGRLRAVPIRETADAPPVLPSPDTIGSGAYRPLTRPVFLYVRQDAYARDDVRAFIAHYLARVPVLASEVGYVAPATRTRAAVAARLEAGLTGSIYAGARPTTPLDERLGLD